MEIFFSSYRPRFTSIIIDAHHSPALKKMPVAAARKKIIRMNIFGKQRRSRRKIVFVEDDDEATRCAGRV
jgi:hypothetical protein